MPREYDQCQCGDILFYEFEQEQGICGNCQDKLIENSRASQEWRDAHGTLPPKAELPHPDFKQ